MRKIIVLIAILAALCGNVEAVDVEKTLQEDLQIEALTEAAPQETRALLNGALPGKIEIGTLLRDAIANSGQYWKVAFRSGALMLLIVLFCTVVQLYTSESLRSASMIAAVCAVTTCCAGNLKTMIGLGRSTILQFSDFSKALIPSVAAAAAASGAPTGSAALSTATMVVIDLLISFQQHGLIPLIGIYIALSAAGAAAEYPALHGMTDTLAALIKKSMKILLLVFSGYLTITGIVSGTIDSLSVKTAKMTISSTVPVVGSMLSDATESILLSAKYLKNSIGLFGMLSVLAIGIIPFLQLGIHYLVLLATAFLASIVDSTPLSKYIHALAESMSFLLAITGTCAFLLLISCIAFIRVIVP